MGHGSHGWWRPMMMGGVDGCGWVGTWCYPIQVPKVCALSPAQYVLLGRCEGRGGECESVRVCTEL